MKCTAARIRPRAPRRLIGLAGANVEQHGRCYGHYDENELHGSPSGPLPRAEAHQHTDASHGFALLRVRRERPRRRRAAEERDEIAPFQAVLPLSLRIMSRAV
jgi:hypothetical protein